MSDIMFSVAVITYNQEKYISQTLDSILNQEHDYKYEIVIGEDCSTDNTKKIIEEYFEKYPDIIKPLYNNPNKGLINNYFNVINHCQGKYIMECAGDDYWLPGKVKSQIEFMENNPAVGMCYSKAKVWNENKQKFEKKLFGSNRESFEFLLTNRNYIPAPTVCLRTELVQKYISEIKPQEKDWLIEDYPMWLWFCYKSKVKFRDSLDAVYRVLENSASHSNCFEKLIKLVTTTRNIQLFYSKNFGVEITLPLKNKDLYEIYFNIMISNYSDINRKKVKEYYNFLNKKSIKDRIKFLLACCPLLFKIFNAVYF